MNKNKHNWFCYVCGERLNKKYFLCSMNKATDRVFLSCVNCIDQIEEDTIKILIKESYE